MSFWFELPTLRQYNRVKPIFVILKLTDGHGRMNLKVTWGFEVKLKNKKIKLEHTACACRLLETPKGETTGKRVETGNYDK